MNNSSIITEEARMMSIKDLNGKSFFIPAYQRGFRWNKQQVKELLDDLYDYSKSEKNSGVYCLQPIVVRQRAENSFEVIDGQQRLTAIWLLSICYRTTGQSYQDNGIFYKIEYEGEGKKEYSNLINDISSLDTVEKITERFNNISNDIDSQNLRNTFEYITKNYKNKDGKNMYWVLPQIYNNGLSSGRDIQIIWNELVSNQQLADDELSEETSAIIDKFTNINANKIALTEAELIKAHLLSNVSDPYATSHMWETIERGLNEDQFWFFFARSRKEEKYKTRIDYLFDIWFHNSSIMIDPGDHLISRAAQAKIYNDSNSKIKNADELWSEVVRIYETLLDWYNDYFLYHTIGLLIEISGGDEAEFVKDLYVAYVSKSNTIESRTKSNFNRYLLDLIISNKALKDILVETNEDRNEVLVSNADGISLKLNYNDNKSVIKRLLLLYNIALLVNAQSITPQNKYERFPFDYYKNRKNPIEVEHINPQNPRGKDYSDDDRIKWAIESLKNADIKADSQEDRKRKELLNDLESGKISKLSDPQIEQIESFADIHIFSNLTLLDKDLNIRYSNHSIKQKRKHLIAAIFGLPIPKENNTDDEKEFYEKSVIFPGTKWVFLREYADPDNYNYWSTSDKTEYEKSVKESIFNYLRGAE